MSGYSPRMKFIRFRRNHRFQSARGTVAFLCALIAASVPVSLFFPHARAQQAEPPKTPVVVQPGAPGQPSRTLPPSTRGTLPRWSHADVAFMQGMIMHHAQAVEMTALIASHTENEDVRSLGARISSSQSDEIKFMKRWLAARGEPASMAMPGMPDMDKSHQNDGPYARYAYAGSDGGTAKGERRGV